MTAAPTEPRRPIPATIRARCGMLDDPERKHPCPCRRAAMAKAQARR